MIRQHYTGSSRRAVNIIWNAAGNYDFEPPFLAFFPNGDADDYFNMVIGLAWKWLDLYKINAFFDSVGTSNTAQEAASVLWLGIENCVYQRELNERPILKRLRKQRAQDFYTYAASLSRQQMMLQSMKVFNQEEARWGKILGRKTVLSPAAAKLAKALEFPGSFLANDPGAVSPADGGDAGLQAEKEAETDALITRMTDICRGFFRLKPGKNSPETQTIAVRGLARAFARTFMKREIRNTDLLILRKGSGNGDAKNAVRLEHIFGQQHTAGNTAEDEAYIRDCFGPCIYSGKEMRILDNTLCTGPDASCRLWISKAPRGITMGTSVWTTPMGSGTSGNAAIAIDKVADANIQRANAQKTQVPGTGGDDIGGSGNGVNSRAEAIRRDQEAQRQRNLKFYRDNIFRISESIKDLSAQTDTIFSAYMKYLPKRARQGKIHAEEAWRLPVLSDPDVFLSDSDITEFSVAVDLLLDASQSRMNNQESIASQALIIAKSFESAGIPVRVSAFRSLRGFTVLQQLKDFKDKKCDGIFSYYAGGWNRDGLCLKTMDYLMQEEKERIPAKRILLVLTDASPNDSMQIPPDGSHVFPREYEGDIAVKDAADAVKLLRKDGIRTAAIFFGASSHLDAVHQIYGQDYVRIRSLNQFSDAVGQLLKRALEKTGPA